MTVSAPCKKIICMTYLLKHPSRSYNVFLWLTECFKRILLYKSLTTEHSVSGKYSGNIMQQKRKKKKENLKLNWVNVKVSARHMRVISVGQLPVWTTDRINIASFFLISEPCLMSYAKCIIFSVNVETEAKIKVWSNSYA